jgi:hypothetical protein
MLFCPTLGSTSNETCIRSSTEGLDTILDSKAEESDVRYEVAEIVSEVRLEEQRSFAAALSFEA